LIAVIAFVMPVLTQTPSSKKPSFEVVSVKPADSSDNRAAFQIAPGGGLNASGVTLRQLIQQVYEVHDYRISGGPTWVGSAKYNISAKTADGAGNLTLDDVMPMLQAVLEDRFQLKVHRERKELPAYALVVAKNGPKVKESDSSTVARSKMGFGEITDQNTSMGTLSSQLTEQLGRFVFDRTGLQGAYDFHMQWASDLSQTDTKQVVKGSVRKLKDLDGFPRPQPGAGPEAPPPLGGNGPSIFTALQDQLGLRLEATKGPVQVLIIDHAEKPDAN
jgi:uncharacterized protein (TIGR03435 family)